MRVLLTKGACTCGGVTFELTLPNELSGYSGRSCDCDFCVSRGIAYLSDPDGKLIIRSNNRLKIHNHGSNQADFLECEICKDLIAVTYEFEKVTKGAVNATLLDNYNQMKPAQIISPKLLSAEEKVDRWKLLWLDVEYRS